MDSLFEQESGGFPSQYFFAGEKHIAMLPVTNNCCYLKLTNLSMPRASIKYSIAEASYHVSCNTSYNTTLA
jgi:hypothetical protein